MADYQETLRLIGVTEAEVRAISENPEDQVPFPDQFPVQVRASGIEGLGLFTLCSQRPGDTIAPARIGPWRTPAGRYTNHSGAPNAFIRLDSERPLVVVLVAQAPIQAGEEITLDYAQCAVVAEQANRERVHGD